MDPNVIRAKGETAAHLRLKQLALLWAQVRGYSATAFEVSLPRCRYRADVAAYRAERNGSASTVVFECKQARCDLRRDNCSTSVTRSRFETVWRRREVLEKNLRVHYPKLRVADSLFAEFDSHDFRQIGHQTYNRVLRELNALQHRLYDCTKFETLLRYRCANLFFVVLTEDVFHEAEVPIGWGALVESDHSLRLVRRPVWHETLTPDQLPFLHRIATAGTRNLNRQLGITFEEIISARSHAE